MNIAAREAKRKLQIAISRQRQAISHDADCKCVVDRSDDDDLETKSINVAILPTSRGDRWNVWVNGKNRLPGVSLVKALHRWGNAWRAPTNDPTKAKEV